DKPKYFTFTFTEILSAFSKTAAAGGDRLNFTTNVVYADGRVVYGYIEVVGTYNNTAFAGWQVNGVACTPYTSYTTQCSFMYNEFVGIFTCTEQTSYGDDEYDITLSHHAGAPAGTLPEGIDPSKLFGIDIDILSPNVWESQQGITVWVNTADFSLYIPDQGTGVFYPSWEYTEQPGDKEILWYGAKETSCSTCSNSLTFSVNPFIPGMGGWSAFTFTISPK
ncbi:MAG: hypothetical protein LBS63_01750, partial [Prevotellaceae bacterium]|nr:hypothetical protein [Prevotellaceae bacterium]